MKQLHIIVLGFHDGLSWTVNSWLKGHIQKCRASFWSDTGLVHLAIKDDKHSNMNIILLFEERLFVCVFVCSRPYLLRGRLTDLRQTWWVYVGGPPICPWGVLFQKGQRVDGSTGQRVTFTLNYIIYVPASRHTAATAPFALQLASSRV